MVKFIIPIIILLIIAFVLGFAFGIVAESRKQASIRGYKAHDDAIVIHTPDPGVRRSR